MHHAYLVYMKFDVMHMLQNKKLVCFDLDGTLIDSVGIWNQVDAQLIYELSGQTVDLTIIQQQRDDQLKKFKQATDPYLEYCGFLQEHYSITQLAKKDIKIRRYAVSHYFLDNVIELKPQAEVFIHALRRRGILTALTTTTSLSNILRYQQNNQKIYSKLNFKNDFDLILTRENVQNIKPHPDVYLKAIEHFQMQAKDCLIFEDSLIGIEAAKQAGIDVVAIYDQYSAHELTEIKAQAKYFVQDYVGLIQKYND